MTAVEEFDQLVSSGWRESGERKDADSPPTWLPPFEPGGVDMEVALLKKRDEEYQLERCFCRYPHDTSLDMLGMKEPDPCALIDYGPDNPGIQYPDGFRVSRVAWRRRSAQNNPAGSD